MNHTKEPWHYQEKADAYTHHVRAESRPGSLLLSAGMDPTGRAEADARRAVACVNAMEGVKNPAAVMAVLTCAAAAKKTGNTDEWAQLLIARLSAVDEEPT